TAYIKSTTGKYSNISLKILKYAIKVINNNTKFNNRFVAKSLFALSVKIRGFLDSSSFCLNVINIKNIQSPLNKYQANCFILSLFLNNITIVIYNIIMEVIRIIDLFNTLVYALLLFCNHFIYL